MLKTLVLAAAMSIGMVALTPAPTLAQNMDLGEFITTANRIPRNPTALLRSDTRRLLREVEAAGKAIRAERESAVAAGRQPAFCPPAGRLSVGAEALLARFNSIPASRRNITVTQALREWMAERYPCTA